MNVLWMPYDYYEVPDEHACLDFSNFLSTLLTIFHVINEKLHPAPLLIYLVNKRAEGSFFSNPACLLGISE